MSIYRNNVNHAHFFKVIFSLFSMFFWLFTFNSEEIIFAAKNSTLALIVRALTPFNFIRLQATI